MRKEERGGAVEATEAKRAVLLFWNGITIPKILILGIDCAALIHFRPIPHAQALKALQWLALQDRGSICRFKRFYCPA